MPPRLSDLKRAAEKRGLVLETPSGGSHWKFRDPAVGGRSFTVPSKRGLKTEITEKYIKKLIDCFEEQLGSGFRDDL